MNQDPRRPPPTPPPPSAADDLPGTRIDVELTGGERLSLRFPHGHALGGGTCECTAPTARLTAGRCKPRERVFSSIEELLRCLFGRAETGHEADEIEVDLDDSLGLPRPTPDPRDTLPEGLEYLGSYSSLLSYMRAMLEPEVTPGCVWILDHLDYRAVQRRWESDGSRLMIERGNIYRQVGTAACEL